MNDGVLSEGAFTYGVSKGERFDDLGVMKSVGTNIQSA